MSPAGPRTTLCTHAEPQVTTWGTILTPATNTAKAPDRHCIHGNSGQLCPRPEGTPGVHSSERACAAHCQLARKLPGPPLHAVAGAEQAELGREETRPPPAQPWHGSRARWGNEPWLQTRALGPEQTKGLAGARAREVAPAGQAGEV